ncbi:hypothetical protein MBLNU457_1356t1 [Dothideomycetes sp. NU457]
MGGPYASKFQALGGRPDILPDVPIAAIFLVFYIIAGALHLRRYLINKKKDHLFVMNTMIFGFCNSRIVTFTLRMAWATHLDNISLAIASNIFVYAGVVMLFAINMIFTQRILRAQHPTVGWSKPASLFFPAIYAWIVTTIIILITSIVQSSYTLSPNLHRIDRDMQLYGQTTFAIIAFLPTLIVPIAALAGLLPSVQAARTANDGHIDKFGAGSMRAKIAIVVLSSMILTLGAAFRAGINWLPPVPLDAPEPWYFSKTCFYVFNFVIELVVVYSWLFVRVDQRFHVPDKADGQYDYPAYLAGRAPAKDLEMAQSDSESEDMEPVVEAKVLV